MPILNGYLEELKQSLYDTVTLPTNGWVSPCKLFWVPMGQGGKTIADTNMYQSSMLPPPQRFIIRRIRMEVFGASTEALACLQRSCLVELFIGCKLYWRGPASTLLLEDRLRKALKDIGRTKRRKVEKYLDRCLQLGLTTPTVIGIQQPFEVRLSFEQFFFPCQNISIRVFLDGTLFRPVN